MSDPATPARVEPSAPARGHEYDAVVVGARVAGAATAMLLARRWHRVLLHLVEQAGFCRVRDGRISRLDLVCTGFHPVEEAEAASAVEAGSIGEEARAA